MREGPLGTDQFRTPLITHPLGFCQDLEWGLGTGATPILSPWDVETLWPRCSEGQSSLCVRQQGGVGSEGEETGAHPLPPQVLENFF